jgi:hypothetical protein
MLIDILSKNWAGTVIGLITFFIGTIVSYYFYRKSQTIAKPAYQTDFIRIIDLDNKIDLDSIEIKYRGNKVCRLTKSYLIFWNDGTKTIDGKDIVEKERLRIVFNSDDGEILYAKVIKVTREVNDFKIEINNIKRNEAIINFDYLDPSDGAVIEILHTFKKSKMKVEGVIKGIPEGIKHFGQVMGLFVAKDELKGYYKISRIASSKFIFVIYICIGLLFIYLGLNYEKLPKWITETNETANKWTAIIMGITFILPATFLHFTYPRRKFPAQLNLNEKE